MRIDLKRRLLHFSCTLFNFKMVFPLMILFWMGTTAFPQGKPDKELVNKLDKYYKQVHKDWGIPGMSVGIVKDGKLMFASGYGVLEEGKKTKVNSNTLFAIASNSKAFTSAMMAMLVQEGKVAWDDKVRKYLPYFELYDPYVSSKTTIRDLLCHRVGLGTFSGDIIWHRSNLNAEEIIRRVKYVPNQFEFRSGFGYSNLMYITAGEVIRVITGKSWGENVEERILKPLGMDRTIYSLKHLDSKGNYASPHSLLENKNIPIEYVDWETVAATGGLISSVVDIAKWVNFNINHGIIGADTLLTRASRNTLWKPHNNFTVNHTIKNDFNRHFSAYGLGWGLSDYHGRMLVGHTGGYDGMITSVYLIPDEKIGVVVLTNGMNSPIRAVTYYTLDAMLGLRERDWSSEMLKTKKERSKKDTRISDRKSKRVLNTKPSLDLKKYAGTYKADIYGDITITVEKNDLRVKFEHTPDYSATLKHWHYDVWKIEWDDKQAWFNFGTVKFNMDNNLKILGIDFDVPNDDIFFYELKAKRVD